MNARWHRRHPMPEHPSVQVRVRWHVAHSKACGCRDMPGSIAALIRRLGGAPPAPRKRQSTR
jgi:hypothetical protein